MSRRENARAQTSGRVCSACIAGSEYRASGRQRVCTLGCQPRTRCGEATLREEHLHVRRRRVAAATMCSTYFLQRCASRMGAESKRSPRPLLVDFVLYVSATNSTRCADPRMVAYALHCQQDATRRPIGGNINICPTALSLRPHDHELLVSK